MYGTSWQVLGRKQLHMTFNIFTLKAEVPSMITSQSAEATDI
jgi:hypothetical protein